MFCTYVVKYLDLIQSTWMTRASIYLIQNIVTNLNYKEIIFQVIRYTIRYTFGHFSEIPVHFVHL